MALAGIAKRIYNYILSGDEEDTGIELADRQRRYVKDFSVPAYVNLYKVKVDAELNKNGYSNVIVEIN